MKAEKNISSSEILQKPKSRKTKVKEEKKSDDDSKVEAPNDPFLGDLDKISES